MDTNWVDMCFRAGQLKRFHAHPTIGYETVAEHSFGVALVVLSITNGYASAELLKAALYHDIPEIETGDVPFTAKQKYPKIKRVTEDIEELFMSEWDLTTNLPDEDKIILKWADMLHLLLYCKAQRDLGNVGMNKVFARGAEFCSKLPPVERAQNILTWLIETYN